jgi:hypothetical protein
LPSGGVSCPARMTDLSIGGIINESFYSNACNVRDDVRIGPAKDYYADFFKTQQKSRCIKCDLILPKVSMIGFPFLCKHIVKRLFGDSSQAILIFWCISFSYDIIPVENILMCLSKDSVVKKS